MSSGECSYEPPISECKFPESAVWHPTLQLAKGVRGFAYQGGKYIFIPLIVAEREGSGDVGRFLDRLSVRCVIQTVTSHRLIGMLLRRGWHRFWIGADDFWAKR